jgi:hypothetical protein
LGVIARKIPDDGIAFENQQMVHYFVHEKTVVRNHQYTTFERNEVFFEDVQAQNIQIVGGFVQHQKIGISHQYGTQIQPSLFAAT